MEGRNHPSEHYYSTEKGRNEFKDTIGIINGIAKSFKRVNGIISEVTENDIESDISATTGISEEYLKNRRDANVFMTELLYGRNDGWFEMKHIHLRHLPAHREDIQLFLKSWKQVEYKLLNIIVINGIACRLEKTGFMDQLIKLRQSFNDDQQFVTFMCESIACRLEKAGFMDQLILLRQSFEDDKLFVSFMCNSIACRLEKAGFMDQLIKLRQSFEDDKLFVTFMCDGITCRLEKAGFMYQLIKLRQSFNDDQQFVTFMCGSIAFRLEKAGFMDKIILLRQSFEDDKLFVTFMCTSIACRLEKTGFIPKLIKLRRYFNDDKQFVTFMCGGAAKELDENYDTFLEKMIELRERVGSLNSLATIMSNSLAPRLCKPGFMDILIDLMSTFGDKFIPSTKDGVVCRLMYPGYIANLKHWFIIYEESFPYFIRSYAALLENASNIPRIEYWYSQTGNQFHLFLSGGIGKELVRDDVHAMLMKWYSKLELKHFCTIFGNKEIVSRVVKKNKFDRLLELYNIGSIDNKSKKLFDCLSENEWKGITKYF